MGAIIVAMILGFTLIVVKMGLDHSRSKMESIEAPHSDATLLMSELEELIASSVSEAIRPLEERVERLETNYLPEAEPVKRLTETAARDEAGNPTESTE